VWYKAILTLFRLFLWSGTHAGECLEGMRTESAREAKWRVV
jgi:hypothetical protein